MVPYQCIQVCERSTNGSHEWILVGASGSKLVIQSSNGATRTWAGEDKYMNLKENETEEPPEKKVKLSSPNEYSPTFSCLAISNDKQYVVAVTAEDKCVRVFQINSDYHLHEISQRCMARRPCAIALTSDDSTILCADKFGDVYALPLISPAEDVHHESLADEPNEAATQKQFVPAASLLTVHSGRNRKVLEEQIKLASKGRMKTKEPLQFKHELLLGHVSMLTDVVYTTVSGRNYILTSDRDEHIRVSRGPPQAHIIECFCQGHEEFVSKLCLTTSGFLISGGGDPYLCVWDWLKGRLLEKICIRTAVITFLGEQPELASTLPHNTEGFKIAISGIWSTPRNYNEVNEVLVVCEGVPAFFYVRLESPAVVETVPLNGNALDIAFISASESICTAVVAVDHMHKPWFTTERRADEGRGRLQCFECRDGRWGQDRKLESELEWFSRRAPDTDGERRDAGPALLADDSVRARQKDEKAFRDVLYGVEKLRKRSGADEQD
ncbi:guanine-N(7)--methyltransferase subunit TRM82 [Lojkania enalia]|uniref:Guanine-N(7)--methyltransferase subunit TRM82 n=1 Tax=Lojkania enalia TaxID=147567 RepID=A0A9P4NC97_9PLEO|nr:guanine-N(7)--methyltransferase subunit TRM82 [Didymosphaeria enalia]